MNKNLQAILRYHRRVRLPKQHLYEMLLQRLCSETLESDRHSIPAEIRAEFEQWICSIPLDEMKSRTHRGDDQLEDSQLTNEQWEYDMIVSVKAWLSQQPSPPGE